MIDTLRHHETPEGVAITLRLAGPLARVGAWLLDAVLRLLVYFALAFLPMMSRGTGTGVFLLLFFLLEWFWSVPFETGRRGATPGKRAFGLRVLHRDGTPVTFSSSILRNLLRTADFFPFAYGIGLVTMLCSREFQRLGDMVADTVVVHDDSGAERALVRTRRADADHAVPASEPPFPLEPEDRQALAEFAARSGQWSRGRRAEVAEILAPWTGARGDAAAQAVLGMARWSEEGR